MSEDARYEAACRQRDLDNAALDVIGPKVRGGLSLTPNEVNVLLRTRPVEIVDTLIAIALENGRQLEDHEIHLVKMLGSGNRKLQLLIKRIKDLVASRKQMGQEELLDLLAHKNDDLDTVLADYIAASYERTLDAWVLIKASGMWRHAGRPGRTFSATTGLMPKLKELAPNVRSAVLTTRGAASRDIWRSSKPSPSISTRVFDGAEQRLLQQHGADRMLENADRCARSAIRATPTSYYPWNLRGAVCIDREEFAAGASCFEHAIELGSKLAEVQATLGRDLYSSSLKRLKQVVGENPDRYPHLSTALATQY